MIFFRDAPSGPKHAWDAGTGMSALAATASAMDRSTFGNIVLLRIVSESEAENQLTSIDRVRADRSSF